MRLEREGVPGVLLVASGFEHDAQSAAADHGMSMQRQVVLDGYYWYIPAEESAPIARAQIDDIIDALTRTLTLEEENPPKLEKVEYPPITIEADSYEEAIEQFHRIFEENRYSDGLALYPPTREAVDYMLTGTNRSPDEIIGTIPVKNGEVTIEKIAINAVMARAAPEYLPVIIAAIEAVADEDFDLVHPQASMAGPQFAIYVSGPIAEKLNMRSRDRLWTYGNRANSTIGRAVRLTLINAGHMWPGVNDMARQRVFPFTYFTFAEDIKNSPWEPHHVTAGFAPEDSTVTVSTITGFPTDYTGTIAYEEPGEYLSAQETINRIINTIASRRSAYITNYKPLLAIPTQHPSKFVFMVTPDMAKDFVELGFTDQKSHAKHIYEATSIPYEELTEQEIANVQARIEVSIKGEGIVADQITPHRLQYFIDSLQPGGMVPLLFSPEDIHFVVAGGEGKSVVGWGYMRGCYSFSSHETRRIEDFE